MVALGLMSASAQAGVNGIYQTQSNEDGAYLHVEIATCEDNNEFTCGTIRAAYNGEGEANEDYEHLGKLMIWKMQDIGSGIFKSGQIWAPDTDKTYNSEMKLDGDTLTVKGCILFICRGQDWTRVK
ncbi:MAG: DUF2147 domain-containing protein [Alphaproteobacteria bacterium]|nr:DUF2147 domain-containing protein [Alphaproteobacteria bacterium]